MSKLSRRSLVTTAAALPALAVQAVSAIASPADDQLVALAGEAIKLNNEFELAHVTGAAWDAIVAIGDQLRKYTQRREAHSSAVTSRPALSLDFVPLGDFLLLPSQGLFWSHPSEHLFSAAAGCSSSPDRYPHFKKSPITSEGYFFASWGAGGVAML